MVGYDFDSLFKAKYGINPPCSTYIVTIILITSKRIEYFLPYFGGKNTTDAARVAYSLDQERRRLTN